MLVSNKKITRVHYVVFFIWLCFTLIAAVYFIQSRLILFDPNLSLKGKSSDFFIQEIKRINGLKEMNLSNTIVHFTSDNCSCTKYSREHKKSINKTAQLDNFQIVNVNLPGNISTVIPSTPAILIINDAQELLYFGPYSAGLACSQSNGYVETVLQNYAKGYDSNLIISDVEGCYCNIQ